MRTWAWIRVGILGSVYSVGLFFGGSDYIGPAGFIILVFILLFRSIFIGDGIGDQTTGPQIDFAICCLALTTSYMLNAKVYVFGVLLFVAWFLLALRTLVSAYHLIHYNAARRIVRRYVSETANNDNPK